MVQKVFLKQNVRQPEALLEKMKTGIFVRMKTKSIIVVVAVGV